jgi:hypothetical protein
MEPMPPTPSPVPAGFSRRALLAASAAGVALLVVGCTAEEADPREQVTNAQADELAAQVAVQEALVAAFAAAGAADPALATAVAVLADQAADQLGRLRDAAPGATASAALPSGGAPPGPEARAWLRTKIAETATSHATACLDQSGARAALLGSIAAGLRGHEAVLA